MSDVNFFLDLHLKQKNKTMAIEFRNQGHNIYKIECILKRELSASEIVFAIDQLGFFEETPETIADMLENFY